MGVLATMVTSAQPALFGGGCTGSGTDGATWQWKFVGMVDSAGSVVNLSTVTGTCKILTAVGGAVVATPTFAGVSDGSFTITLDEAVTAGLAAGETTRGRVCKWRLSITDGTDVIQVWGPVNSDFVIYAGV